MLKDLKKFIIFLTRIGAFKYLVIPFSFYNRLISWQYLINNILFNFLYHFIQTYLNHIFIYNKTLKNHYSHVYQILERLQEVEI